MSDTDSDADSSNAHSDNVGGDEDSSLSPAVRVLCDRLRANDPSVLHHRSGFHPTHYALSSEAEWIEVFQALQKNAHVKRIDFTLREQDYPKRSAEAVAKYLTSSQTLQAIDLRYSGYYPELPAAISLLLQGLSRNTSVTELSVATDVVRFGCLAFQALLTRTQTLQTMSVIRYRYQDEERNETQTAAIASGFANYTTLRELKFEGCRAAELAPVLTALQEHPTLRKIHLTATPGRYQHNLSRLDID
jgi:hypothetical protein